MRRIAIALDVTDALGREISAGTRLSIAAWVFIPDALVEKDSKPVVIALLNGGTYDKRYFDVQIPGRTGYSMAEHLRERGNIVVLLDHLGIGQSSRAPKQMLVTRQVAAAANHEALQQIYALLRAGDLDPALPPIPEFVKVGGGHSLGGMQTITQQAVHRTYDCIMVLGYTAIGVHLTINGQLVSNDPGALDFTQPDYTLRERKSLRATFHWDDVPDDVLAVDDGMVVEVPYVLSRQAVSAGIVTDDAAQIDVPVYICLGERDVSPDPYREPSFYRNSPDVTLHILPRSAHCQSFASSRLELFDRAHDWVRSLPAR